MYDHDAIHRAVEILCLEEEGGRAGHDVLVEHFGGLILRVTG